MLKRMKTSQRVADFMNEIFAASPEQSEGIEQVDQAVGQMDQITQQYAVLVQEAAAAAASLEEQANLPALKGFAATMVCYTISFLAPAPMNRMGALPERVPVHA